MSASEISSTTPPETIVNPGSSSFPSDSLAQLAPESIAKDALLLRALNEVASASNVDEFRLLVDEANMAASKGGDESEQRAVAQLIESRNYRAAASELLAIADRPGGVTTFINTDLPRALRSEGRTKEAEAFEAELGLRTLYTLERMEELGLGEVAPAVFDITFWRANQYLKRGTPEWRRAFECLARVAARIPDDSTARNAGYVRSLGDWARLTVDKFDAQPRESR